MVSRHSRSASPASAAISTSNPLRGTTAPTDRRWGAPSRLPRARGTGSLPGRATVIRSTGHRSPMRQSARWTGLVTTTPRAQASARRSLWRRRSACSDDNPHSSASGWCTSASSGFCELGRGIGQGAQGKAVDDDRPPVGNAQQPRPRLRSHRFARKGKSFAKIDKVDLPADPREFGDDPLVVCVTAGRRVQIARHGEGRAFHHKGASYCARATCDSESVTRIDLSSRPARPSSPARAGSPARRKYVCSETRSSC